MSLPTDAGCSATTAPDVMDRYVALETGDSVIVYDRQNHRAWLQSDATIAVSECR
jgi:hypothetical protein